MAVPTPDCYAVAVGEKEYRAKDGFVETDNPRHAKLMMKVCSESVVKVNHEVPGKTCTGCAFNAFAFSKKCPRCGRNLPPVQQLLPVS